MSPETPKPEPDLITHVPTAEDLQASQMDPRLEDNLTRGALKAIIEGSEKSSQELNLQYPAQVSRQVVEQVPQSASTPSTELPAPFQEAEHERTLRGAELAALREQIKSEDAAKGVQ
jgi:hypothetical protein